MRAFPASDDAAFGLDLSNGRTLEFTVQPMENGGMVVLVEDITERKIAEAKINHLARFDALTGLPNRTVLRDRMEKALAEWRIDNMCAIHFIDLDQFKQVNDTLGHTRGDMLLEAVAERLKNTIRDADVISRFGGDEFVILQAPIKSIEQGEALATRVLNALGGTYDLDGHKVVVTTSIGIALAKSRIDPEQLLRNADIALYQAKSDGRGTWRWFEAKMEASAQARRALELDLRSATESEAFELYYQPIFNLKTRRIETCEALLRWPHHERGMVSPAEFIPVAEEMGLIVEIGNQVLYKACLECRRWPGDTAVAVNLSPIQFDRSNVPALVRETLAATNLPAHRLEIEITETTLLQNTRAHPRRSAATCRHRRENLVGRFRHGVFEPELSAQLSVPQGQDRPIVPAGPQRRRTQDHVAARHDAAERPAGAAGRGRGRRDRRAARIARRRGQHRRGARLPVVPTDAGGRFAQALVRDLRGPAASVVAGQDPQRRGLNRNSFNPPYVELPLSDAFSRFATAG